MTERPNIFIICGRNKRRSRTAEFIFKNDSRFNIRSAGLSPKSDRKISEKDLNWAGLAMVMENTQRTKLKEITDDYEFMDEKLVQLLNDRINAIVLANYNI